MNSNKELIAELRAYADQGPTRVYWYDTDSDRTRRAADALEEMEEERDALKYDQGQWRKGVALICSSLGEHNPDNLSCVRISTMALKKMVELEQATARIAELEKAVNFVDCEACEGAGWIADDDPHSKHDCEFCGGTGKQPTNKRIAELEAEVERLRYWLDCAVKTMVDHGYGDSCSFCESTWDQDNQEILHDKSCPIEQICAVLSGHTSEVKDEQ